MEGGGEGREENHIFKKKDQFNNGGQQVLHRGGGAECRKLRVLEKAHLAFH